MCCYVYCVAFISASGKSNQYSKNRAEAKVRQKWYKEKSLERKYRKEVKRYEASYSQEDGDTAADAGGSRKRIRGSDDDDHPIAHGDSKSRRDGGGGSTSFTSDGDSDARKGSSEKKNGTGNKHKKTADLFAKEKKAAQEAREAREANAARIAQAEADRVKKLQQRKLESKKRAQRDSRGRPRVRNTIQGILGKLQTEK